MISLGVYAAAGFVMRVRSGPEEVHNFRDDTYTCALEREWYPQRAQDNESPRSIVRLIK